MISKVALIEHSARKPPMTARDAHTFTPDTLPLLLADGIAAPAAQAAVQAGLQVLQELMRTFNARHAAAWAQVLNSPMCAWRATQVTVWRNAADYAAANDLAPLADTAGPAPLGFHPPRAGRCHQGALCAAVHPL